MTESQNGKAEMVGWWPGFDEKELDSLIRNGRIGKIEEMIAATPKNWLQQWNFFLTKAVEMGKCEVVEGMIAMGVVPESSHRALHKAAARGELRSMRALVAAGAKLDALDGAGWTPLRNAILNKKGDAVLELIEMGAKPDEADLTLSVGASYLEKNVFVKLLESADKKTVMEVADCGSIIGAAVSAGRFDMAEFLLEKGFALGLAKNGASALTGAIWATVGDRRKSVAWLLSKGASLVGEEGAAALVAAAETRRQDLGMALLRHGADANCTTIAGERPLSAAAANGLFGFVKKLLKAGADCSAKNPSGETALFDAANHGDPRTVRALLEAGCDPNAFGNDGRTPLVAAADCSSWSSKEDSLESAMSIMHAGGRPEEPFGGLSAFGVAIRRRNLQLASAMARDMAERGVDDSIVMAGLRSRETDRIENRAEFEKIWTLAKLNASLKNYPSSGGNARRRVKV